MCIHPALINLSDIQAKVIINTNNQAQNLDDDKVSENTKERKQEDKEG
jgi:hypothetical protein